jgi:KaiC/GvpD/RAD55 family RecA-like ATPase
MPSKTQRVYTGIEGFDEICSGGLIKNRTYMLSGTAGAGKTIFGLQYLYNGATRYDENGIFLTTDETPSLIKDDALGFGWDFEKLEKEHKVAFVDVSESKMGVSSSRGEANMDNVIDHLIMLQKDVQAQRAVLDSSTSLSAYITRPDRFRAEMLKLGTTLRALGLTSLIVTELLEDSAHRFGVETFISDGVIILYFRRILDTRIHSVEVYKMRGSNHSHKIHPFDITQRGIVVNPVEGVFGEF